MKKSTFKILMVFLLMSVIGWAQQLQTTTGQTENTPLTQSISIDNTQQQQPMAAGTATLQGDGWNYQIMSTPQVITHSSSQAITIVPERCPAGNTSFYRVFDLDDDFGITTDFQVSAAEFGVAYAVDPGVPVPFTVNVYSSIGTFPNDTRTLQASSVYMATIANSSTVVSVPISATIPLGENLVYELVINLGSTPGDYAVGANTAGETGNSWISAPTCGVPNPVPNTANSNYVMNIVGNEILAFSECGTPLGQPIPAGAPGDTQGAMTPSVATVVGSGIIGPNYYIDRVEIDLNHTFTGDLLISLVAPDGTVLVLSDNNGGAGDNYTNTVFQDGGATINTASAPFTGTFQPQGGTFANTFNGIDVNGNWELQVLDELLGDTGTFNNFCIYFIPNEAPVITCITDQTEDTAAGVCTYTHSGTAWDATATDDGTVENIEYELTGATTGTGSSLDGVTFNLGVTTVTWTVTDNGGRTDVCSYTVTIEDNEDPVITCIGNETVDTDAGVCTYTHSGTAWDATATDNCSVATVAFELTGVTTGTGTSLAGVVFNLGTTTVNWTATDGSTNTDVCSYTVTIEDNEDPVITCIGNETVDTDAGVCTYTHSGTAWDATATDNCSATVAYELTGVTTGTGTSLDGVLFNLGTTTVTWTATDGSTNTDVCSYTVTVEDNEDPVITCIGNETVDTDAGVCTYTHSGTAWDATATDNCSVASITFELTGVTTGTGTSLAGVVFNLGETTVTWTATDGSTNTDVCSYTVAVEDNEPPVISCITNETVDTDPGVCTYTHSGTAWDATATDNCSVSSIEYVLTGDTTGNGTSLDGVVFNLGTTTITWTATDGSTNTDVCSYTVTVEDNEAPVISCTTNKTADTNAGVCTYTHLGNFWDASYDDNCTATLSYELTGATTGTGSTLNGVTFNLGETTVTWTATDVGGNTDVCSYTVTVEDNEAPVLSCVADTTVETDTDVCSYTHSGTSWDATATDNCSLSTLTYSLSGATTGTGTSLDGVTFNLGTTTVTWTATDAENNSQSCTTTITVEDTEAPVIICISSKLRDTDPGECTYTHSGTLWDSLASDNCNVFSLTYELSGATTGTGNSLDGVTFNLGITTVVWTATDDAGNTDVCTYTVTIEDNEAPLISCTSNQSVDTDADVCTYTHSGMAWDATATDNCGVAAVEYTLSGATTGSGMTLDGIVFNLGTTTVVWTATDNNGNTHSCTYEITVEDNQSPEISCGGNQTVDADAGSCSYTHSGTGWNATATDNCGVTTITYSLSGETSGTGSSLSGVTFNPGTTTVTWTATDAAGNTDVCSFTVTVEDNESPQAVCQDLTIQLDANGQASILVEDLNGGSSDNCGNSDLTYTASKTEFDCGDVGVNTVIFTVTDAAGNSSSCTAIVTVEDLIAPEALCVTDFTLELDENGEATLTAAMLDGGSMDNCEIADITISQTEFDCSDIGENTVTVTVTDSEGNSTSCTSVVTVADSLPPVISCPGDLTVDPNANGTYVVEDFTGGVTATDNCTNPVVLITQEPAPNTMLSAGTTYTVTFTAEDEAGNTSSCSFELEVTPFLGTDSFNLSSLTMYPNPAATMVNIGNPNLIAVDQISIYDVRGRMVVQQQYSTPQGTYALDVSELSSAVYMVMIQSENKQTIKRLIVE